MAPSWLSWGNQASLRERFVSVLLEDGVSYPAGSYCFPHAKDTLNQGGSGLTLCTKVMKILQLSHRREPAFEAASCI